MVSTNQNSALPVFCGKTPCFQTPTAGAIVGCQIRADRGGERPPTCHFGTSERFGKGPLSNESSGTPPPSKNGDEKPCRANQVERLSRILRPLDREALGPAALQVTTHNSIDCN